MLDVDRLAEAVLIGTKALLAKELAPLREQNNTLIAANEALTKRLAEVESREPKHGKDADLAEVREMIAAAIEALPKPADPEPLPDFEAMAKEAAKEAAEAVIIAIPEPVDLTGLLDEAVRKGLEALPAPQEPEPLPDFEAMARAAADQAAEAVIKALPEPEDMTGRIAEVAEDVVRKALEALPEPAEPAPLPDVGALVSEAVEARLKALPAPELPEFAKPEAVEAVRKDLERISQRVDNIQMPEVVNGKDAPVISGIKQNDDGELIVKMSDGETFNAGKVRGADGFGFDDLSVEQDGERGFVLRFQRGERVKSYPVSFDVPLDRGVWRERSYEKGDGVTWAGSWWIAQAETDAKPGTSPDWRLAVKAGRNGRDVVAAPRADKPFRLEGRDAD